jgi:ankyrin repeat protein
MLPDLEKLRASAKRLKKAFAAGDVEAARKLRAVVPGTSQPKHADFLHVIARENHHESWPKLKFAVEAAQLNRAERADRLAQALYFGQQWVVQKLLEDDSRIISDRFDLQLATYDLDAVQDRIAHSPSAATEPVAGRSPILHLAFSKYIHMEPSRRAQMLDIAALLVENGANVNDGHPSEPGASHMLSALYGALGHANNLPLAEWLLENGANPNDDESLYHSTELGHHDGLRLLMRFGVSTSGTNAIARALDFNDVGAVRLLLEYGANPNEAVETHPSGQPIDAVPALHQAARRWCSPEIVSLLLDFGADPFAIWHGHTAYGTARIYGNTVMARILEERGKATPLTPAEEIFAACAAGRTPATRIPNDLTLEDQRLLTRLIAGPVPLAHIKALVAAGVDPNQAEEMGLTALHVACWEGLPERVAYLLELDPDLSHRNAFGGDALDATIHGSEFCPKVSERDHVACARLLLDAGATFNRNWIGHLGNEEMASFFENWLADD